MSVLRNGLRLRARIVLAFALGGLFLSVLLSAITYSVTRSTNLDQRTESAERQFFANAASIQDLSLSADPSYSELLRSLPQVAGGSPILRDTDEENPWIAPALTAADLPSSLVSMTESGDGAFRMRYDRPDGVSSLALGVAISNTNVSYFEVVTLSELDGNLSSLLLTLFVASFGTTMLSALLGVWASTRVLAPLTSISSAAGSIAAGDLSTRLEERADPDLETIIDSFNNMAGSLEARIERDARFASDVSHELRSPLMTLRASIEVLESRRDELSERSQAALDLLSDDVHRFQRLVEDLLEISRSDAGSLDASFDPLLVAQLLQAVMRTTNHLDITLNVGQGSDEALVNGDKRRLFQVISNLLENADKYAGGATAVNLVCSNHNIRIEVSDAGSGVPTDERNLVFERFARGSAARRRGSGGGAGLGLALVAEHVRLHNGRVWVEDRTDGLDGSVFVVELPRFHE
ncbi:MAG: HAMP domain-containing histidine kinase [Actinomycetia bacterium]|nr:HAMP domain-containing histidine kinase [Actinomycetes bacterium]MCP4960383.1 HAMP domain-containing histidine kinase [Actinomycetes bacterium]